MKNKTVFDQYFINDEEDRPIENKRMTLQPRDLLVRNKYSKDHVFAKRKETMPNEIFLKPKDFSVRAMWEMKEQKEAILASIDQAKQNIETEEPTAAPGLNKSMSSTRINASNSMDDYIMKKDSGQF